jgi:ABC-type branched-subunit amino acid transport system ATPase component
MITMDIGRAIAYLRRQGKIAKIHVEHYSGFATCLASRMAAMDRGRVVLTGTPTDLDENESEGR